MGEHERHEATVDRDGKVVGGSWAEQLGFVCAMGCVGTCTRDHRGWGKSWRDLGFQGPQVIEDEEAS